MLEDSEENKRHAGHVVQGRISLQLMLGMGKGQGRRFSLQPLKLPLAKGKMDNFSIIHM